LIRACKDFSSAAFDFTGNDDWHVTGYTQLSMKQLQLVAMLGSIAFLVSCETTETTGVGNQEQKRMAAIQREQAENAQYDESDVNLWNAHQDRLITGTNPAMPFRR
jgi:hypothetical protein